jgi:ankyrin repeat protein
MVFIVCTRLLHADGNIITEISGEWGHHVYVGCSGRHADTPGSLPVTEGDAETVRGLVEKGDKVNARTTDGLTTPLHCAATEGQLETIRLLLKMGGYVHAQDANGSTPLHLAAHSGHKQTVRVLVEMGTDVNAGNAYGLTPLHFAVIPGHVETLKVLTEMGADVHAEFSRRRTPLQVAEEEGHEAVASFLRKFITKNDRRSKSKAPPVVDPAVLLLHQQRLRLLRRWRSGMWKRGGSITY